MDTQLDAELRANILVEALPYIQEYYGQTVAVSYTHLTLPTTNFV